MGYCFSHVLLLLIFFVLRGDGAKSPATPMCYAALDIVQVQDMTSSFDFVWETMSQQVPRVAQLILDSHPASRFGFSTFGDKPITGIGSNGVETTLGFDTDYCFHVDVPLQRPDGTQLANLFAHYYQNAAGGGGDWPENPFGAIYRSLLSRKLEWKSTANPEGEYARVVVMVTDATGHEPEDVKEMTGHVVRPFDISADGMEAHADDENYDCDKVEYPSISQVAKLLVETETRLIVLAAPGGVILPDGRFSPARSLALKGVQYRHVEGLKQWYQDVFQEAGAGKVFVAQLDPDMNMYFEAFQTALKDFQDWLCNFPETTTTTDPTMETTQFSTEPPTTTPDSTDPPTTTHFSTDPATTTHESTDPATTEPATTEPATTEPATTEPATTEPATTEPATTEPAIPEPTTTVPAIPEPTPTEPACEDGENNCCRGCSVHVNVRVNAPGCTKDISVP